MGAPRYRCYRYYTGDPDGLTSGEDGRRIEPPATARDWRHEQYDRFLDQDFATAAESLSWLHRLVVAVAVDIQHLDHTKTPPIATVMRQAEHAVNHGELAFQWSARFPYPDAAVVVLAIVAVYDTTHRPAVRGT